jgi:hypothetical protein
MVKDAIMNILTRQKERHKMNIKDIKDILKQVSQQPGFKEDMENWLKTGDANTGSVMYDIKSIIEHTFRSKGTPILLSLADSGPEGTKADMAVRFKGETYDIAIRRRTSIKEEA